MDSDDKKAATGAVTVGAAAGIANAGLVFSSAVTTANAAGLSGAAAISSALATLGGGAIAAGGGGMAAGVTAIASAAAWPAAVIAVTGFGGYQLYKYIKK
ncbi:hypothetical protein ACK363_07480 [Aeromonas veronii]|nr:hypothetical protein [Aeromonas veronii]